MSLSDAITSLGAEQVTVLRPQAGSYVAGRWVPGAATAVTVTASVQPLNTDDIQSLPEGFADKRVKKIYSRDPIYSVDQVARKAADVVQYGGINYEVMPVSEYQGYYRAILREVAG